MGIRTSILDKMGVIGSHWIKGRPVLVTGASGFIGAALTDALLYLGARVFVLSQTVDFRQPLFGSLGDAPLATGVEKIIHGDLRHRTDCLHTVAIAEPDFVFHLGAMTQVTEAAKIPVLAFETNALGTLHILEACRMVGKKKVNVIVASSDKAYGKPLPTWLPLNEDDELNPIHPYDLSKACADMAARSHAHYYGTRVQVTRLANVYGPGDTNWKRLIPGMIRWMAEGNQPIIRSDGKQVRQYLYIGDAVTAYLMLAHAMDYHSDIPNGQAWNFAPEDKYSVMEIVEHIALKMKDRGYDVQEPKVLDEAKDETPALELETNNASDLRWQAMIPIGEGINRTIDWVLKYLNLEQSLK